MQRKFYSSQRILGVVGLSVISVVNAQQQQPVSAEPVSAPAPGVVISRVEVTGTADAYDARRDDTAAKIVVNNAELVKYGDASVVEALKRVPGVTVTSTGRGSDIRMRGLGGGYTQILVNGERAPVGFSIDSLSPGQVERIEVIRSATAEFSTESIAGTINIVLKKVVKQAQRQVQFGYGGDATERTPRIGVLLSDRDGDFSYSLSGNARSTGFDRNGLILETGEDLAGRSNQFRTTNSHETGRFEIANIIPRLNWKMSNGDTLSSESVFTYTRYRFNAEQVTTTLLGSAPLFPAIDWNIRTHNAFLKSDLVWKTRLSPASMLEVKVGAQGSRADNDSRREGNASMPLNNRIDVKATDKGLSSSGKLSHKIGEAHQLIAGWEASHNERDETNDEFDLAAGAGVPILASTGLKGKITRSAAFVQDEWTVTPNWSVYLGVRGERIDTDITAGRRVQSTSNVWSPIAQTLIKFPNLPNDQLRLALTRTFKAPDVGNLLPRRRKYEINSATNPDIEGNPDLQPELARGVDATYEHYFTKNALFSVGLSSRKFDNYTLTEVSYGADGRWVGRPINAGSATIRGLELETKFPLGLVWKNAPAIEVRGSLSRNWSSVAQVAPPGNRVAQQIPLSATLAMDYTHGALTTGGSLVFLKGAWTRVTAAQSVASFNRREFDVYALWKLNPMQQLRVTVGNVLGQDTTAASQYRGIDGSTTRTTIASGQVSVRALFEHKF